MKTEKKIGIWMDHSKANLMEYANDKIETKTISSKYTLPEKEQNLNVAESQMHNKEQNMQSEYYKELLKVIENYKEVILFGPTDAKAELFNVLRENHHFSNIKIEIKQTDKMTENQQHAFVREYFSRH